MGCQPGPIGIDNHDDNNIDDDDDDDDDNNNDKIIDYNNYNQHPDGLPAGTNLIGLLPGEAWATKEDRSVAGLCWLLLLLLVSIYVVGWKIGEAWASKEDRSESNGIGKTFIAMHCRRQASSWYYQLNSVMIIVLKT